MAIEYEYLKFAYLAAMTVPQWDTANAPVQALTHMATLGPRAWHLLGPA